MNFIINRQGKNHNKSPVRYESIFEKYSIPLLRLPTHAACIEYMIELELSKITENNNSV